MLCASAEKLWCILLKDFALCIFCYLISDKLSVDTLCAQFFLKRLNLIYSNLLYILEADKFASLIDQHTKFDTNAVILVAKTFIFSFGYEK